VCAAVLRTSLTPTAQRCRLETEKHILDGLFSSVYCHKIKKKRPNGNLTFNNLGIFQSLKLRILMEKSSQFLLS